MSAKNINLKGNWDTKNRDVIEYIPIYGQIIGSQLLLFNSQPDRDVVVSFIDAVGTIVLEQYIFKEQSANIEISISDLECGIYTLILKSPYPSDRLYATFEK